MSNLNNEFDVLRVVELARIKKYEITSAGFALLDKIDNLDTLPKKLKNRKPAVQALYSISEDLVKFDYFTAEQRAQLLKEANMSDAPHKFKSLFNSSHAPVAEEDTEEDEIPEEEPKTVYTDEDSDGFEETSIDDSDEFSDDFDDDSDSDDFEEEQE